MRMKLNHVHVRSQNVARAEEYYVKVLGGRVVQRCSVPGMPIVRVELGGQVIALSPPREGIEVEALSGNHRWGAWQIAFQVDDIEAAYRELRQRGAEFRGEPFEQIPGLKVAYADAPDGIEIELMEFT